MILKLLRYDLRDYFLKIWFVYAIFAVIPLAISALVLLGSRYLIYEVSTSFFMICLIGYMIIAAAFAFVNMAIPIVSYYRGLYSSKGYLSYTLPVTATQHLTAKLLFGLIINTVITLLFFGAIEIFYRLAVATVASPMPEVGMQAPPTFIQLVVFTFDYIGYPVHLFVIIAVVVVLFVLSELYYLLTFYCSISLGGFMQNRIIGSVIVYVILNTVNQFIGGIVTLIFYVVPMMMHVSQFGYSEYAYNNFVLQYQVPLLIMSAVLLIVLNAVMFIITRHMMGEKLNLN